jgi:hypothetical protein
VGLCQEEFASPAEETFFRRSQWSLPDSDDWQWRGERLLQLVVPPKENAHWRKSPVLDATLQRGVVVGRSTGLRVLAVAERLQS